MSSYKFENAEFEIVEGDNRHIFIKVPKHLSNEAKQQFKQLRDEFISNIKNHKEYLKAHGVTFKWVANKVMNGISFNDLAAIVAHFVLQHEIEIKQQTEAEVIDAPNANETINQIQNVDLDKQSLTIFFKKGATSFNSIQKALKDKFESYEHISDLYIQYKRWDTNGQVDKMKSLATKDGLEFAHSLI